MMIPSNMRKLKHLPDIMYCKLNVKCTACKPLASSYKGPERREHWPPTFLLQDEWTHPLLSISAVLCQQVRVDHIYQQNLVFYVIPDACMRSVTHGYMSHMDIPARHHDGIDTTRTPGGRRETMTCLQELEDLREDATTRCVLVSHIL
jgi:hypothetical protein